MPPPLPRIFCSSSSWRSSAAACSCRVATSCSASGGTCSSSAFASSGVKWRIARTLCWRRRGGRRRSAPSTPEPRPPRPLGRLRRGDRPGQLRGAVLLGEQREQRRLAPRGLLVLDVRRRDDHLRDLAWDRLAHRDRPLGPTRAALAPALGTSPWARCVG